MEMLAPHTAGKLALIQADAETQLDWLRKISDGIGEIRPHVKDAGWFAQVEQAIDDLRAEFDSRVPEKGKVSSGWFRIITSLLMATVDAGEQGRIASDQMRHVFEQFTLSCSFENQVDL